jgi:hypothetical protein
MSQLTHTQASPVSRRLIAVCAAVSALIAAIAVTLVIAIDSGSSTTVGSSTSHTPATRTDGGPEESSVAASVGARPVGRPDGGPDESTTAAEIATH